MLDRILAFIADRLSAIGTIYTASWTASSTSSITAVTGALTIPKGIYIAVVATPYIQSGNALVGLRKNTVADMTRLLYGSQGSYAQGTYVINATEQQTLRVYSESYLATSYAATERGGLKIIRIA